jgi:hypothetical protein
MEKFERRKLIEYVSRLIQSRKMSLKNLAEFCDWFSDHSDVLELDRTQ